MEWGSLPFAASALGNAPKGDGHPVLVLPGFIANDVSTSVLRGYLRRLGYDAHAWELGRNFGHKAIGREGERLIERLRTIHEDTGERVSLVGWSLGGIMARLLAARAPDAVRQVITFGSPFTGDPKATNVWRAYEWLTGERVDGEWSRRQFRDVTPTPAVPTTAIYTRGDGIVAWQNCMERPGTTTENIEVTGSHCGLAVNPAVLYAVADRLAQPDGDWRPFVPGAAQDGWYPAGHA